MKKVFLRLLEQEVLGQRQKEFKVKLEPVEIEAKRNPFLQWLYGTGLVEASSYSAHCADKLFFAHLLQTYAPQAASFHPLTIGLSWLPETLPELKIELARIFPRGFVVKKAGGIDSGLQGVYLHAEDFFAAFAGNTEVFLTREPVPADSTGLISSGEKYLVQEKISGGTELRLHSLQNRVVREATFTRWNEPWDYDLFLRAENAVQEFLSAIPEDLVRAQAWSFDVICEPSGQIKIIEVNTNRGRARQWSGDMVIPETLGAYVRHLEQFYGAKFLGESGELFRRNLANREKYRLKIGEEEFALHERLKAK